MCVLHCIVLSASCPCCWHRLQLAVVFTSSLWWNVFTYRFFFSPDKNRSDFWGVVWSVRGLSRNFTLHQWTYGSPHFRTNCTLSCLGSCHSRGSLIQSLEGYWSGAASEQYLNMHMHYHYHRTDGMHLMKLLRILHELNLCAFSSRSFRTKLGPPHPVI